MRCDYELHPALCAGLSVLKKVSVFLLTFQKLWATIYLDLLHWQKNRTGHAVSAVKLSVTRIILSLNSSCREVDAKVRQQGKTNISANEPVNIKHLFFRVVLQRFNSLCFRLCLDMVEGFPFIWVKLKLSDLLEAKQTRPETGQTFRVWRWHWRNPTSDTKHAQEILDILHCACTCLSELGSHRGASIAISSEIAVSIRLCTEERRKLILHHGWCQNSQFLHHLKEMTRPSKFSSEISTCLSPLREKFHLQRK